MKTARWRSHCSPAWPLSARDWLRTEGSLTVRLQRGLGQFKVAVDYQGLADALVDEHRVLHLAQARHVRTRNVVLWAGGSPQVVAHSVVRWLGAQSDWPFWRQLGTRSLGTVLFRDHRVRRLFMQYARLPAQHPLTQAANAGRSPRPLYARRAVYVRGQSRTPLLVTEVFLHAMPGVQSPASGKN
jgi:chorismate--pyruvate lyase